MRQVANGDELINVLVRLQEAILDGSLDDQIELAADSVKARFAKRACLRFMLSVPYLDARFSLLFASSRASTPINNFIKLNYFLNFL
jgi:hypothetical protein